MSDTFAPWPPSSGDPATTHTEPDPTSVEDGGEVNPEENSESYDYLYLAGVQAPGVVVDWPGASNPRKWDKKAASGSSGATLTYTGDELSSFSFKLQFGLEFDDWSLADEFHAWEEFKQLLKPPTEKKPQALDIYHPALESLPVPIRSVIVDDVSAVRALGNGVWEVEIKFTQYRAPKPATTKSSGSKSGKSDGAKDDIDNMIDSLAKDVANLA